MTTHKKGMSEFELSDIRQRLRTGGDAHRHDVELLIAEVDRLKRKPGKAGKKPKRPDAMWVYTAVSTPFAFGGTHQLVKTFIRFEALGLGLTTEVIKLSPGYWGVMVRNPERRVSHVFEFTTGALIGTAAHDEAVIKAVQQDAKTGDPKIIKEQLARAKLDMASAQEVTPKHWFSLFKELR